MKKEYLHPDFEIIYVISRDVIALSVDDNEPGGTNQQDFEDWLKSFGGN